MGMKFETGKKTVQSFASGLDDNRTRRDWVIRQCINHVYFEVSNTNMQDDDYVINMPMVKVRTVSDKYCFFKALLNVCVLPSNEEAAHDLVYKYGSLVTKNFKETTNMMVVKNFCVRLNVKMLDIGSVY